MKILYYTVEKELEILNHDVEAATGNKTITIYEIANDVLHMWFDIDTFNTANSERTIQNWLDDNGFSERKYEFIQL